MENIFIRMFESEDSHKKVMRIKNVTVMFLLATFLWACSTTPKVPSPPPIKIEVKGLMSFTTVAGQMWRVLDTGQEKFAVNPLRDCQLDLPPEDIKMTPTSFSWSLRSDRIYAVRGYTGSPISIPDIGTIRIINANYIGTHLLGLKKNN